MSSCPSRISAICLVLSHGMCLPVLYPVFQSVHTPAGVHQSLRSDFVVDASEGRAPPSLSGRLAHHCGVEDPSSAVSGSGSPVVLVQASGYCCQLGEVQPPAVHSCPVSGDADRHVSREGIPIQSSCGSLSGGGDLFSVSFVATSTHVAAVVGPLGVPGAFSPSRPLMHASVAVVSQVPLVPHGERSHHSDPSPGSSSVPVAAYQLVSVEFGSPPVRSDSFGGVVPGREFFAHQR